ncbi:hypothetical protein Tco_0398325 [Tanacetum coccineum]
MSDIEIETYEDEPYEIKRDLAEDYQRRTSGDQGETHPNGPLKDFTQRKRVRLTPSPPKTITAAMAEAIAQPSQEGLEIHSLEDQLDDLLHGKLETIQEEVDGLYAVVEAAQQDVETLQATLREAWELLQTCNFYLD